MLIYKDLLTGLGTALRPAMMGIACLCSIHASHSNRLHPSRFSASRHCSRCSGTHAWLASIGGFRRTQHAAQCIGCNPAPGLMPARLLAGDELFSDANEYKEIQDGFFLEAEGKVRMRCRLTAADWCSAPQANVHPDYRPHTLHSGKPGFRALCREVANWHRRLQAADWLQDPHPGRCNRTSRAYHAFCALDAIGRRLDDTAGHCRWNTTCAIETHDVL